MKKLLILFTFFFCLSAAFAQSKWSPRTSLPDSGRYGGVSFSIGNYGYVGLGINANTVPTSWYKDFWQFNPSTNTWTQKSSFPGKGRFCPTSFVIGNKGYVVTGVDSDIHGYSAECWEYDPSNNTWTQKANFPGLARGYDVAFAIGRKGYVGIGGQAYALEQKDFYCYDTATNTWTRIADFPGTSRINANAFAVNGKGYLCFGADSSLQQFYKDIWEYDTGVNTWTLKGYYPGYSAYAGSGFVIGNNIYVGIGDDSALKNLYSFWEYNPTLNTWTNEASYIGGTSAGCFSFSIGDTGYVGLGADTVGFSSRTFFKFIIDSATGITQVMGNLQDISVYPNPFNRTCLIVLPSNNSDVKITLYDIQGNKVKTNIKESINTYIIDREGLADGVYILSIGINKQFIYKKLIITN